MIATMSSTRLAHVAEHRPSQHLGHPRVALEGGDVCRFVRGGRRRTDQITHRGLGDAALAQRGKHLPDVVQEGVVGPDDEHSRAPQPVRVRVEQVRGTVQAHRCLAGARRALHAQRGVQVGAHEVVLVGLDGGDDVAHRAHPRTFDLLAQQVRTQAQGLALVEVLVLVGGQFAVVEAEPAAQSHAHPRVRGGAVEGPGDRSAPVDDHWVTLVVAHVPAADMQALGGVVVLRIAVGAAEERRGVGFGRQRGEALRPHPSQALAGQGVHAVVGDAFGALDHLREAGSGDLQLEAFGGENGIVGHD